MFLTLTTSIDIAFQPGAYTMSPGNCSTPVRHGAVSPVATIRFRWTGCLAHPFFVSSKQLLMVVFHQRYRLREGREHSLQCVCRLKSAPRLENRPTVKSYTISLSHDSACLSDIVIVLVGYCNSEDQRGGNLNWKSPWRMTWGRKAAKKRVWSRFHRQFFPAASV